MSYRKSCLSKSCSAQPPAQPPSKALWPPKQVQQNTKTLVNALLGAHNQLAQNHLALRGRPPELLKILTIGLWCAGGVGCGVGGAGDSRTIENIKNSIDFHGFGLWCGGRGCIQNFRKCMKFQRLSWFWAVVWGARVPPELKKMHDN